ncbi:thiamine pyrophosphate protein [Caballeronia sordidicola]|uniref:Thiamine pyrophosphate protein n=1 Tax=Caballeronia sordidicola TaxID=196367 RepID=A0A158HKU8_CABSO|nr:thiamine pyrophosphate protein [Caballeronia sordidicola]
MSCVSVWSSAIWTADWWQTLDKRVHESARGGVNSQRTVWELSPRLPSNAIVTKNRARTAIG